jgi:hypothetical protein
LTVQGLVFSMFLDPLRSIWLSIDLQQMPTWSKLWPRGYRHMTPISSTLRHKQCWDKCLNVNGDYVEVWCVLSASMCHIYISQNKVLGHQSVCHLFLKILCILCCFSPSVGLVI